MIFHFGNLESLYFGIMLLIAIIFLLVVSYCDLKTSLIDIRAVIFFDCLALICHGLFAFLLHEYKYILFGISSLAIFLFMGYLLYFFSKWGEGDAIVLGSIYFIYPFPYFVPLHFVIINKVIYYWYVLFFNIAIFGVFYSLMYAFIFSLRNREFYAHLKKELSLKHAFLVFLLGSCLAFVMYFFVESSYYVIAFPLILFISYFFYVFAKLSDEILFTKKIKLKDVKEGDTVLGTFKKANFECKRLDAISKEEIDALIKAYGPNKVVEVKDMVRYIPSFLFGFIFTVLFGDAILYYLSSLIIV